MLVGERAKPQVANALVTFLNEAGGYSIARDGQCESGQWLTQWVEDATDRPWTLVQSCWAPRECASVACRWRGCPARVDAGARRHGGLLRIWGDRSEQCTCACLYKDVGAGRFGSSNGDESIAIYRSARDLRQQWAPADCSKFTSIPQRTPRGGLGVRCFGGIKPLA